MFFDRADLPPAQEYDHAIQRALEASDLLVFLLSPASVAAGRYTLTELKLAERRWPHPGGRVLPVLLHPVDRAAIPPYLRAVGMLEPRGDVAAEVAHEVDAIARSRSVPRRVARAVRTPAGLGVMLALAAVITVTAITQPWRSGAAADGAVAPDSAFTHVFADPADRTRARAVASTVEGFAVAMASPNELVRFSASGARLAEPRALPGQPLVLRRAGSQLLLATEAPDRAIVLDTRDWSVVLDAPFDPSSLPGADTLRVSGDIRSLTTFDGEVWAVTGERDGEPALLRLRLGRLWSVVSWTRPPEAGDFDARALHLRTVAGQLWGVSEFVPSDLYRIFGTMNVQTFSGHDRNMISCANELAESENGNLLLLDCDNRLLELDAQDDLRLIRAQETLPSDNAPGRWTDYRIERDGASVFVALNTEVNLPDNRPGRARIARVDSTGVTTLLDVADAVVTSMAVTDQLVVVVLRRLDGMAVVSLPRVPGG